MKRLFCIVTALLFVSSVYSQVLTKEMSALIAKGNKVFLDFDKESVAGVYLVQEFTKWGYWKVVEDVEDAQFILTITILISRRGDDFGGATSSYAEFKTLDDKVFHKSPTYKGAASVLSNWNSYKASAMVIMRKYFKKTFKK